MQLFLLQKNVWNEIFNLYDRAWLNNIYYIWGANLEIKYINYATFATEQLGIADGHNS